MATDPIRGTRSRVTVEGGLSVAPHPFGASPVTASAVGTTADTVATLPGVAGKTTYIAGFHCSGNATAALAVLVTLVGTITGTMNFRNGIGATPAVGRLDVQFDPPIPASAPNTAIVLTQAAAGAAGVTAVSAWGFQL